MDTEITLDVVPTGFLSVNTYVLNRGAGALVIDPGGDVERIDAKLAGRELAAVLLTHSHFDHIGAVDALLDAFPEAKLYCHPLCARRVASATDNLSEMVGGPFTVTHAAETLDGDAEVTLAGIALRTFFVPGHTPDHLCYYLPDKKWLFCGDTVFAGGIGRSDFPGGDGELLVRGIRAMLDALPPDAVVFPGHGGGSTVGGELKNNPYL